MRKTLALIFMAGQDRRSWVPVAVWGLVAVASLTAAVVVAVQPGRLQDLHEVRRWLAFFEQPTGNPYTHFVGQLDYPPIALVVLRPLRLIPESSLAAWFVPISILITAVAAWVFVAAIADRLYNDLSMAQRIAIVAMILAGSSVRGAIWLGQTMALAVLFGALALTWSRRRPFSAAFALALCSFKPHLAVGFGLAILLIDGYGVILVSGAIVISASLIIAAAVDQSVLEILATYAQNLISMYGGADRIRALLSVRWVFEDVLGNYVLATMVYVAVACGSLVMIGLVARRAPDAAARTQTIAAAMLWPLLFLPSQMYNGLLAAPALWLLMWPEAKLIRRESNRLVCVAAFATFSILDVPRVLRFGSEVLEEGYWLYKASYYLSPLRLLLVFGFIVLVAWRRRGAKGGEVPA